jgi:toxin ParE1/3/4
MDAVEQTSEFLLANSEAGAFYPAENNRLAGIRVFQVRGFPNHLIFYRELANGIEVLRVLHGARNVDAVLRLE